jgi:hypothetical protein
MEGLFIEEEKNTPTVIFDPLKKEFTISGKSFPENSKKFYSPIIDWMKNFNTQDPFQLKFDLVYVSSSSIIALLELLRAIEKLKDEGCAIDILWCYDEGDEDIMRVGMDYEKITTVPFQYFENAE